MKGQLSAILLLACLVISHALELAKPCDRELCKIPDCKCSSTESGTGIPVDKIPQIVMLTFDDAVTKQTHDLFAEALFDLKNPDGCPVAATHFVTHDYTDYTSVHDLWSRGHEIALHSVTHVTDQEYWRTVDLETMKAEFGDMRKIINALANVPESDIHGIRVPFLQIGGNMTLEGIQSLGLQYDSSMPNSRYFDPALWPYTFEYASIQECAIPPCSDASFPGIWEVPMTVWEDLGGITCSMVDGCTNIPETAPEILDWMISQFDLHYKGSRSPFPAFMHAAWFLRNPENFEAYKGFVKHLQSLPDVYIVSVHQAIEWVKNPKPTTDEKPFGECQTRDAGECVAKTCQLASPIGGDRWMTSCVTTCPDSYPWIGNPYGA